MTGNHARDAPSQLEVTSSVMFTHGEVSALELQQAWKSWWHFLLSRASKLDHLEVLLAISSSHPNPVLVLPNVRMFLQVVTLLFQTKRSYWKRQI